MRTIALKDVDNELRNMSLCDTKKVHNTRDNKTVKKVILFYNLAHREGIHLFKVPTRVCHIFCISIKIHYEFCDILILFLVCLFG